MNYIVDSWTHTYQSLLSEPIYMGSINLKQDLKKNDFLISNNIHVFWNFNIIKIQHFSQFQSIFFRSQKNTIYIQSFLQRKCLFNLSNKQKILKCLNNTNIHQHSCHYFTQISNDKQYKEREKIYRIILKWPICMVSYLILNPTSKWSLLSFYHQTTPNNI